MSEVRSGTVLAAVVLIGLQSGCLAAEVDVQLVLAADVSRSMTIDERLLQRNGYAAAFRHPELVSAVLSGARGRIAVTYVEWAGSTEQSIVVPWTIVSDSASAEWFAHRLDVGPTGSRGTRTSISGALLFAARQFAFSGMTSPRKTIDVSGDGINDEGLPIAWAREVVTGRGITINGLSIRLPDTGAYGPFAYIYGFGDSDLHAYYKDSVIGGPGAFAIAISDPKDFPPAIRRKLVVEIAGRQRHPGALTFTDAIDRTTSVFRKFFDFLPSQNRTES